MSDVKVDVQADVSPVTSQGQFQWTVKLFERASGRIPADETPGTLASTFPGPHGFPFYEAEIGIWISGLSA